MISNIPYLDVCMIASYGKLQTFLGYLTVSLPTHRIEIGELFVTNKLYRKPAFTCLIALLKQTVSKSSLVMKLFSTVQAGLFLVDLRRSP